MEAGYRTVAGEAQAEFVERRSRFIGRIWPVRSEQEALAVIAAVKKEHWDATHNVYAYLLRDGQVKRYSDDGEPQGTAGIPVLEVLQKNGVTDCVCVVTRYFGGVLLGAGGLVRAYAHGAALAVREAGVVEMVPCAVGLVRCDYSQYGRIGPLLEAQGALLRDTAFTDVVTLTAAVPEDRLASLEAALTEASAGTLRFEKMTETHVGFPTKIGEMEEK